MDAHGIDILKYLSEAETPSVTIQGYSNVSASGTMHMSKLASPIAQKSDLLTLEVQDQGIRLSAEKPMRRLHKDEDKAMWLALENSSTLVAKGRAVR